ncbi:thiol-disulfide oxidoreductase DCC family protein [Sediminibacterium sp.]|uniref:thiol-disulfide oxidoreductase DCC family protein n=1 Tax=Sediminibacterium sp. TaxID=1917865 RepID=UPI0025CBF80B|nr:thiol-disulfide oxidoreductase DCC family protein [Sediminibacterium sp.]MBT9484437.1 thiol-disulfide oxidoreductase DCC family protein [Sediminibacterium sp.]
MEILSNTNPVILFDGVCNLCNSSVQFVIKHDPKKQFRFASLQGEYGQQVLKQFNLPTNTLSSFILLKDHQIYTHSTGALKVAKQLSGAWPLLYVFIIIPPFIRNAVYQFIANNRYKWFGKKESCAMPSPELKSLFY